MTPDVQFELDRGKLRSSQSIGEPTIMTITREELNPCTIKLTITLEEPEVKEGFDRAFKHISKKIKLPGFRPGHAPRAMLEGLVSKEDWYEEAADHIVRNGLKQAIAKEELEPDRTTRPTVEVTKLEQDTHTAEFIAKIPLPPKVVLGEATGLPVEMPAIEVRDEEVEFQVEEFRKRKSSREKISDRGVIEGDVAVVNIKLEDGAVEGRNFMTIAGQTFPQLDEALMGMTVEEIKSMELTFPDNFQEKDWANQTKSVQVTLNSLSSVKLPELDDEFAKSLKVESVEDLKVRISDGIRKAKEQMIREITTTKLLDALQAISEVHVSDNMWEGLATRRLRETAEEQSKAGKTLEEYAKDNGMTVEELVKAWNERAKTEVQRALLIQQVFTDQKMGLTEADLNVELYTLAKEAEVTAEEAFNMLKQNEALDELQFRAMSRKVGDFLLENANIQEIAAV